MNEEDKDNKKQFPPSPMDQANEEIIQSIPVIGKFLVASWNTLIHLLIFFKVLWVFKKTPWLFVVLLFLLCGLFAPASLFFAAVGFVGLMSDKNPEGDFFIHIPEEID